jgi:putative transposase
MTMQRRQHSREFKAKVAREALCGERTMNELAAEYGVHPAQITPEKKVALEALSKLFSSRRGAKQQAEAALKAALYQQMGQLKVELDWLQKQLAWPVEATRASIEPGPPQLRPRQQCALPGLARSSLYYQPVQARAEALHLMRLIDSHTRRPPCMECAG